MKVRDVGWSVPKAATGNITIPSSQERLRSRGIRHTALPPKGWTRAKELIREAIDVHLEGMRENGDEVPVPSATTEYITV